MIHRLKGWSTLPGLVILAAVFAHVSIETKARWARLQRIRDARRTFTLSWLEALRFSGLVPICGGATLTEGQHTGEFLASEAPGTRSREAVTVLSGQNLKAGAVVGRVTLGIGRVSIPTVTDASGGAAAGNGTVSKVFAGRKVEVGNYVVSCTAAVAHGGVFSITTPSGDRLPDLTMTPGSGGSTDYTSDHINFTITDGGNDFAAGDKFTFVVSTTAPTVIGGTGTGTISALALGPDAKPGNYRVINIEAITNGGRWQVLSPDGDTIGQFLMTAGSTSATAFATRQISFTLTDATDFILGNYFDVAVFNTLGRGKGVAWDPKTYDGRHRVAGVLLGAVDASAGDLPGVLIARDAVVVKSALQWGAAISAAEKRMAYEDFDDRRGIVARDSAN